MLPETTDDPIPQDVLDSLARISPIRIDSNPSPPPKNDELLPEIIRLMNAKQ